MNNELKKRHLAELKAMESQYNRNLQNLIAISDSQKDLTSRMQLIINKFKDDK